MNTAVTSVTTTSRTAYTDDNAAVEELVDTLQPKRYLFPRGEGNQKDEK